MSVITLRPNGTIASAASLTGAGSAHTALNDNSDSSYLQFTASSSSGALYAGDLDDLTLPAGATIKELVVNLRTSLQSITPGTMKVSLTDSATGNVFAFGSATVGWTSPTTVTLAIANAAAVTDAMIDGAIFGVLLEKTSGPVVITRVYEAYVHVITVEQPTLTVDAPTGTVDNTNQPTVSWTPTLDGSGGAQTVYQVKVYTDAQYGAGGFNPNSSTPTVQTAHDPSLPSAAGSPQLAAGPNTSWPVTSTLPDDTYRAYVRVAQTVNGIYRWSNWEYTEFEVDVAVPAMPTVDADEDNDNARHVIVITDQPGDTDTNYWEVQRSTDHGATWTPMRQLASGLFHTFGSPLTIYDYEAEPGVETLYRARGLHDYSGVLAAGDWGIDGAAWSTADWWLKHPNRPALNVPVTVHSYQSVHKPFRQAVLQAIGAPRPIVISDTPGPVTAQITLRCDTLEAQAALDELLDLAEPLLLQGPTAEQPPGYVSFSDRERQRWVDLARADITREVLQFTVVDSPAGNVVAWP